MTRVFDLSDVPPAAGRKVFVAFIGNDTPAQITAAARDLGIRADLLQQAVTAADQLPDGATTLDMVVAAASYLISAGDLTADTRCTSRIRAVGLPARCMLYRDHTVDGIRSHSTGDGWLTWLDDDPRRLDDAIPRRVAEQQAREVFARLRTEGGEPR